MKVVKIIGGLGNQMFQYAFALDLSLKGYKVYIDISSFKNYKLHGGYKIDKYDLKKNIRSIRNTFQSFLIEKLLCKVIRYEKLNFFDFKSVNEKYKNIFFKGYFQNEKYFISNRAELLKCFKPKKISLKCLKIENKIRKKKFCSIHIRRGDYLSSSNQKVHGLLSMDYYNSAINLMIKNNYTNFFVFSDDIEWCKQNINFVKAKIIFHDQVLENYEDLYLMSKCSSNIIANSSFSWWGAWLNENQDKIIIAPKMWLISDPGADVIPKTWIKL